MSAAYKIKLLILPKFDIGPLGNGVCGEGELFYQEFLAGGEEYDVMGLLPGEKLYVRDGIALALTHAGKVNTAVALTSILSDSRFDCSGMHTLSVGCAGTNYERTVMGDVILASAFVDYDLGHHVVDSKGKLSWFPDEGICCYGCVKTDRLIISDFYSKIKNIQLQTTDKTIAMQQKLSEALGETKTSDLLPSVKKGTFMTSDNYWKGKEGHENAKRINEYYKCPDDYMVAEMEDVAVARVLQRFNLDDKLLALRVSVNLDCYMYGATPEKLWSGNSFEDNMMEDDNEEGGDIFDTAMHNLFEVGKEIVNVIMKK